MSQETKKELQIIQPVFPGESGCFIGTMKFHGTALQHAFGF